MSRKYIEKEVDEIAQWLRAVAIHAEHQFSKSMSGSSQLPVTLALGYLRHFSGL